MEDGKKPRILLVADYSNFHATLAKGLRNLGCDVTLVSDGGTFMNCERDVDISRRFNGKIGGFLHTARLLTNILPKLRGYDIVSFRDPQFLNLRPQRIKWFLNYIVRNNKACFQSYLTTDLKFLDMLEAPDSPLRYSEWFVDGEPNRLRLQEEWRWKAWHAREMAELTELFYRKMRGAVTALYEYQLAALREYPAKNVAYGGIPVDTEAIEPQVIDTPRKVRIFLARDRRRQLEKGSDLLEIAAHNVVSRHSDKAEFVMVENVSRDYYLESMRSSHILLDQIYSYTPATMALEAMASGLTVVSGAEPEFYEFIGEKENFPVINAPFDLEQIEKTVEKLVLHPESLRERGLRGREFVLKHNNMDVVARRFLNFWMKNV